MERCRRSTAATWLGLCVLLLGVAPAAMAGPPPGVEVDNRDEPSMIESAIRAFDHYLASVDRGDLDDARDQVMDPGHAEGRLTVVEKLLAFIRGRLNSKIENEGVVVRVLGDWALVVYQYDTTVNGQTTRIITTAWMIKQRGYWRQFIVAPRGQVFWEKRRADFEALQRWFDEHAQEIAGQNHGVTIVPTGVTPGDTPGGRPASVIG